MITINNIPQRREAVNAINEYDQKNGLNSSQKAKYERPLWAFVASILPGNDVNWAPSQKEIISTLAKHNINITQPAVHCALRTMIKLDESIHPHRRNCGISCYEAVKQMGNICVHNDADGDKRIKRYSFGAPHSKVLRVRKAFNLTIQVKP